MRKSLAIIRANWLTSLSYRLETFFSFLSLILGMVPLYFISRALQPMMSNVIRAEAPEYFGFIVIGLLTFTFVQASVGTLHGALGGEISTGSFEALMATPTSLIWLLLGMVGQAFSMTMLRAVYCIVFASFFGAHFVWSGLPSAALALLITCLVYLPFGIMAASLVLAFRTTGPFPGGLLAISGLLGGVYYPTQVIPAWLQGMSVIVPLTYGLRAVRRSILDGAPLSASASDLLLLLAASAVLFTIGLAMFTWALRFAKRAGTLAQY
jgi:ABC-2 type transport system permease protein